MLRQAIGGRSGGGVSVEASGADGVAAGVDAGNALAKTPWDGGAAPVKTQTLAIEQASPLGQLDLSGSVWPLGQQSCGVVESELRWEGENAAASSHAPANDGRPAMTSESMSTNARANITSV